MNFLSIFVRRILHSVKRWSWVSMMTVMGLLILLPMIPLVRGLTIRPIDYSDIWDALNIFQWSDTETPTAAPPDGTQSPRFDKIKVGGTSLYDGAYMDAAGNVVTNNSMYIRKYGEGDGYPALSLGTDEEVGAKITGVHYGVLGNGKITSAPQNPTTATGVLGHGEILDGNGVKQTAEGYVGFVVYSGGFYNRYGLYSAYPVYTGSNVYLDGLVSNPGSQPVTIYDSNGIYIDGDVTFTGALEDFEDDVIDVTDNMRIHGSKITIDHEFHVLDPQFRVYNFNGVNGVEMGLNDGSDDIQVDINGDLYVSETISNPGGDIAEVFDLVDYAGIGKGDVVVIDQTGSGALVKSRKPYDRAVAGVISSTDQATMINGVREKGRDDKPLALAGHVLVKVTNENGKILPGDLLTSSSTLGHAMKCDDAFKCFGAVIGKATQPLNGEKGVIKALVDLQ